VVYLHLELFVAKRLASLPDNWQLLSLIQTVQTIQTVCQLAQTV
jgi:hypothetical protein